MAVRFYLVPAIITTAVHPITQIEQPVARLPKYTDLFTGDWTGIDFGNEPYYLLAADVDTTEHANIAANGDVSAMPANIDNTLGGARQTVEDALESRNLPGNWVTTGMTYRTVLRVVAGAMLLAQKFHAAHGSALIAEGVTLGTPYSAMPTDYRDHLRQSIDALGYDRSMLGASSTLRDMLREIGQQTLPVTLLGVQI